MLGQLFFSLYDSKRKSTKLIQDQENRIFHPSIKCPDNQHQHKQIFQ